MRFTLPFIATFILASISVVNADVKMDLHYDDNGIALFQGTNKPGFYGQDAKPNPPGEIINFYKYADFGTNARFHLVTRLDKSLTINEGDRTINGTFNHAGRSLTLHIAGAPSDYICIATLATVTAFQANCHLGAKPNVHVANVERYYNKGDTNGKVGKADSTDNGLFQVFWLSLLFLSDDFKNVRP